MSNLYVSDLDGTLLRSNEVTSEYTNSVINSLVDKGMIFSYATARSLDTDKIVTKGIEAKIPLIVYNGFSNNVYPIVYAYINGKERFSFVPELCTKVILSNDEDGVA